MSDDDLDEPAASELTSMTIVMLLDEGYIEERTDPELPDEYLFGVTAKGIKLVDDLGLLDDRDLECPEDDRHAAYAWHLLRWKMADIGLIE